MQNGHPNTGLRRMGLGPVDKFRNINRSRKAWRKHGPIVFEPVSAVALNIKASFERERPEPFFILPQVLRDQVYDYVRHSERADDARFTAKEGREPHTNSFGGALGSG